MKILEVIESKHWVNILNGRTASIYGAVPWTRSQDEKHWKLKSRGFTWRLDNGTVGLGRQPVATRIEAEEIMKNFNNRA